MKKLLFTILFLFVCLVYVPRLSGQLMAASLRFDKTTTSATNGGTFDVQIIIDPGQDQITSTDVWLIYDRNILSVSAVKDGTYFPTVLNDTSTAGKVYVAGLVNDPTEFKTGVGTVATVTFRATVNGTTTLTYQCSSTQTETSKIIKNDINSTNIIDCSSNGSETVTISSTGGGGGGGGSAVTPTTAPGLPTATAGPTLIPTSTLIPSPTEILPSPTIASISAMPTALPQSGAIENMVNIILPGILLLTIGGVLKVLLKI